MHRRKNNLERDRGKLMKKEERKTNDNAMNESSKKEGSMIG